MKTEFLQKLRQHLLQAGMTRVHPESAEPTARLAVEALAGMPHFDEVWAGDLHLSVQIVIVASGERVAGVEFARRAQLLRDRAASLSKRVNGEVQVLQLALYERPVPPEEQKYVLERATFAPWWPLAHARVASWVVTFSAPALHDVPFRGWPAELSADQLRALLA